MPRRFSKDELLFVAGDEALGLYVIVEGSVRAFRESLDGREQVIHVEAAGATIAEVPVFDDGNYPSTVAAQEDTETLFIDKRARKLNGPCGHGASQTAGIAGCEQEYGSRRNDVGVLKTKLLKK
jgi:hypothetical protein